MLTIYKRVKKRLIFFASYFITCLLFRKNTLFQVTKQQFSTFPSTDTNTNYVQAVLEYRNWN